MRARAVKAVSNLSRSRFFPENLRGAGNGNRTRFQGDGIGRALEAWRRYASPGRGYVSFVCFGLAGMCELSQCWLVRVRRQRWKSSAIRWTAIAARLCNQTSREGGMGCAQLLHARIVRCCVGKMQHPHHWVNHVTYRRPIISRAPDFSTITRARAYCLWKFPDSSTVAPTRIAIRTQGSNT